MPPAAPPTCPPAASRPPLLPLRESLPLFCPSAPGKLPRTAALVPPALLPAVPCAVCAPALLWLPEAEELPLALSRPDAGDGCAGEELPREPLLDALAVLADELEEELEDEDELDDEDALGMDEEREDDEEGLGILGLDDELDEDELEGIDGIELCEDCCCVVDSQAARTREATLSTSSFLIAELFMEQYPGHAGLPARPFQ